VARATPLTPACSCGRVAHASTSGRELDRRVKLGDDRWGGSISLESAV